MREVSTLKRVTWYTFGLNIFAQVVWFWIHKPIPESIDDTEHSQSSRFYVVMKVDKLHKEYQDIGHIGADWVQIVHVHWVDIMGDAL